MVYEIQHGPRGQSELPALEWQDDGEINKMKNGQQIKAKVLKMGRCAVPPYPSNSLRRVQLQNS